MSYIPTSSADTLMFIILVHIVKNNLLTDMNSMAAFRTRGTVLDEALDVGTVTFRNRTASGRGWVVR